MFQFESIFHKREERKFKYQLFFFGISAELSFEQGNESLPKFSLSNTKSKNNKHVSTLYRKTVHVTFPKNFKCFKSNSIKIALFSKNSEIVARKSNPDSDIFYSE